MHESLMAAGFRPARILANRAALMAMRPLGNDSFRHELMASKDSAQRS
jgi:hypothetical protein